MARPDLTDLRIRPLREGDEEALSRFYKSLSAESRRRFRPYADVTPHGLRMVTRRAAEGADLAIVVLDGSGRIIAHLFISHVSQDVPHLGIGLLDSYHGKGLGAALMRYLIALARHEAGKHSVGLTVMKENERAVRLYTKLGFEVTRDVSFRSENDSYEMRLDFS